MLRYKQSEQQQANCLFTCAVPARPTAIKTSSEKHKIHNYSLYTYLNMTCTLLTRQYKDLSTLGKINVKLSVCTQLCHTGKVSGERQPLDALSQGTELASTKQDTEFASDPVCTFLTPANFSLLPEIEA
jgi:hypothetical protein